MVKFVRLLIFISGLVIIVSSFAFPDQARKIGQEITESLTNFIFGRPTTSIGAGRQPTTVDLMEDVRRVQREFQDHMNRHEAFPPKLVNELEALMQPSMPYEVPGRAMRAGQVIGGKRFGKVLLQAMTDPNPAVRRTAVGKANDCPGLNPDMAPADLANDSDNGVRSAFDYWKTMHQIRVRNNSPLRELPGAPGSSINPD